MRKGLPKAEGGQMTPPGPCALGWEGFHVSSSLHGALALFSATFTQDLDSQKDSEGKWL